MHCEVEKFCSVVVEEFMTNSWNQRSEIPALEVESPQPDWRPYQGPGGLSRKTLQAAMAGRGFYDFDLQELQGERLIISMGPARSI